MYTESKRLDIQYHHSIKIGIRREARVSKPAIEVINYSFYLSLTYNMLSKPNFTKVPWENDELSVFSVESLHPFYHEISKTIKDCTEVYLTSVEKRISSQGN